MNAARAILGVFARAFWPRRPCRAHRAAVLGAFLAVFGVARAEILLDARYQYDAAGQRTAVTVAGQTRRQTWDALGRLQSQSDALDQTTTYGYNATDAPTRLIDEPDMEWLMIDSSHCKVHPHAAGAVGGNEAMSRTKGGLTQKCIWPWMRLVCRSEFLLQKVP